MFIKDPSVYLLAGTEKFLKEEALAKIKLDFLDKESRDLNFNVFYGASASAEDVLECACTAPFLGRKRVVLVRRFEELSASDKKFILSYTKTAYRHTLLILETSETNLRQGLLAEIGRHARVIFCQPLKGKQLYDWISSQIVRRGKKIEEKARRLLVENLGGNLAVLANSLDILVLYIGRKETIEVADVRKLIGRDVSAGVFELFDVLVARDKKKALQILGSLFNDGVTAAQILGALAHNIISEKNKTKPALFKQRLKDLQKAECDIKRGRLKPRLALELLAVKLSSTI